MSEGNGRVTTQQLYEALGDFREEMRDDIQAMEGRLMAALQVNATSLRDHLDTHNKGGGLNDRLKGVEERQTLWAAALSGLIVLASTVAGWIGISR